MREHSGPDRGSISMDTSVPTTDHTDTTSRADYTGMVAVTQAWERLFPVLEADQ